MNGTDPRTWHIPVYIVADKNNVICRRCKKTRVIVLPASVNDVVLQMQAFGESHRNC